MFFIKKKEDKCKYRGSHIKGKGNAIFSRTENFYNYVQLISYF